MCEENVDKKINFYILTSFSCKFWSMAKLYQINILSGLVRHISVFFFFFSYPRSLHVVFLLFLSAEKNM